MTDNPYNQIDFIPFVVMLAAESADTDSDENVEKFGTQLSSEDPLGGLLLTLCQREIHRHNLSISAESQLQILETLQTVRKRDPIGGMDIAHSFVGA
jgi:hypothetical protein